MPNGESASGIGGLQRRAATELQALSGRVVERGVGPLQGSIGYAEDRLRRARRIGRSEEQAREAAIRWIVREAVSAAGTTGFVTGLGGFMAMPVTVPASAAGNFLINARMVGAIAYLRGYTPTDPNVQTMIQLVVAGVGIEKMAAEFGVKVGEKAVEKAAIKAAWYAIEAVPVVVVDRVGIRAGYLLVARYGTSRTAAALSKMVPILGGLAGGAVDASFTRATGALAKKAFPHDI
jgi:hypothetical protein